MNRFTVKLTVKRQICSYFQENAGSNNMTFHKSNSKKVNWVKLANCNE
jgi:hypothetical protein